MILILKNHKIHFQILFIKFYLQMWYFNIICTTYLLFLFSQIKYNIIYWFLDAIFLIIFLKEFKRNVINCNVKIDS